MGDRNVFHMIHQENVTDLDRYPDQSVLMVSARLDGVNIFDKMEVGYGSPTSSIVTLLATAELLNRYIFKLGAVHKLRQIFRGEGGLVKT